MRLALTPSRPARGTTFSTQQQAHPLSLPQRFVLWGLSHSEAIAVRRGTWRDPWKLSSESAITSFPILIGIDNKMTTDELSNHFFISCEEVIFRNWPLETLESYRQRWDPRQVTVLAQQLREFADSLEAEHKGRKTSRENGRADYHRATTS